jgi:PadR family transcriptional regulator, regulatory protein PadR
VYDYTVWATDERSDAAMGRSKKTELLRGTLDLLILRALELQPQHGVAVAERIRQITQGTFVVPPGSLFPALHRLEHEGWISGEWSMNEEGRRVKHYTLTRAGQRQLTTAKSQWQRVATAMGRMLAESSEQS